jgi:hypothetical protein
MMALGEIMIKELDEAIRHAHVVDSFVINQLKEKFGILQIHHNQPRHSEIDLICRKFQLLSGFTCQRCGCLAPNAKLVFSPWIRCMCPDCYIKTEHISADKSDYAELTKNSKSEMPDKMIWEEFERYDEEKKEAIYKKFEVDISDTVDKISKHWEERVANGTHIVEESKMDRNYTLDEIFASLEKNLEEIKDGNE